MKEKNKLEPCRDCWTTGQLSVCCYDAVYTINNIARCSICNRYCKVTWCDECLGEGYLYDET